jgi:hypothetical protein
MFKAPQKPLRSSWVQIAFSKPKASSIIKKSLSNRPTAMIKDRGNMMSNSTTLHSNLY